MNVVLLLHRNYTKTFVTGYFADYDYYYKTIEPYFFAILKIAALQAHSGMRCVTHCDLLNWLFSKVVFMHCELHNDYFYFSSL